MRDESSLITSDILREINTRNRESMPVDMGTQILPTWERKILNKKTQENGRTKRITQKLR